MKHHKPRNSLRIQQAGQQVDNKDSRRDTKDSSLSIHLLSGADAHDVRIDHTKPSGLGRHADGRVLRQRLPNPSILPFICPDYQYEVVTSRIVGMEEVRYESKET